ncbi:winged helix-turn-helix domain-containing protein [Streptomyces sp. AHA2]|uniref:winged helix-turn-helix domain-containing protein n=1 Tax=Streptomyces sp. AHA2 TaxID=3064526 RepID=UPI003FA7D6BC
MGPKTEAAYVTICGWVLTGRYRPGDKLPSERAMCEELSIGRTALRQVLAKLVMEGKLEVHQRSHYRVPSGMRITWVIEDHGGDSADVPTVDTAAEALAAAVRQAYAEESTETLANILLNTVAPLRMQLVTDGRYAVEHGRTWEARQGGIFVTLSPN